MTYEEIVKKVKNAAKKADASSISEHVAFQFNVTGEGEGIFYVEIKDGQVNVEPYEYYDRNAIIIGSADTIVKLMTGKLDPILAFTTGKIKVEGDAGKALILKDIVKKGKSTK